MNILSHEAISHSGCCGLVDDSESVQASQDAGFFGSLALPVIEIGWYGYYYPLHFLAQIILGVLFDLTQNQTGYLLRGILPPVDLNPVV